MKTLRFFGLTGMVVVACALAGPSAAAQEFGDEPATPPAAGASDSWYRSPTAKEEKISLAREKSMLRAQQRMARLDALRWYGYSNSRPTAATMPFTTMYSPAWQMPGGRPFAWYPTRGPIVILGGSPTVLR